MRIQGDGNAVNRKNITQVMKIEKDSSGKDLTQQVIVTPTGGSIPPAIRPVAPPTPFVNRERERCDLAQALIARPGDVHTIVGMPGVGKTALAARVVHDVIDDFPGGVLWLSLEASPPLDTLWRQIVSAYTTYSPSSDVTGTARAFLNDRRPLLVVDSADSAPGVARVLLDERGGATVLLVTRDRNISAGYGGPPLELKPLPRPDTMSLFGARTGTIEEPFLVDRLCELLGDLPLAINLAAGYVNSYGERLHIYLELLGDLSLDEVLDLGDWRGMSISRAFDLTYTRLNDEARLALAVMALDRNEMTGLPTIIAGAGWSGQAKGDLRARRACQSLRRHCLATYENNSYRLHPLVRRYAVEKITDAQRDALYARLTEYASRFVDHAAHWQTHYRNVASRYVELYLVYAEAHAQPTAADYDALEIELANILVAIDRAYLWEQWEQVRRFTRALQHYLNIRSHWDEQRERLRQGIKAAELEGHLPDQVAFMQELGMLAQKRGDYAQAHRWYRRSLDVSEKLRDKASIAKTLNHFGSLAQARGEYDKAQELYQRSLHFSEKLEAREGIASILHNLGTLSQVIGKYDEARRLYQQSLDIAEELDNRTAVANILGSLGILSHDTRDYAEAHRLYQCSLDIAKELGDRAGIASILHELGRLAQDTGDYVEARHLYQKSLNINAELGNRVGITQTQGELGRLAYNEGDQVEAEKFYWQAITALQEIGNVVNASIWMFNLALLYQTQGRLAEALPLLERAVEIAERIGMPQAETRRCVLESARAKLKAGR